MPATAKPGIRRVLYQAERAGLGMADISVHNAVLIVSVVAYLSAVAGFLIAFRQWRANAHTNTASFWLNVRSMFGEHEDVHRSLQTDMSWHDVNRQVSEAEAIAIVAYM